MRSTDPVRISSPEWTPEITEADDRRYLDIVSTELTDEQQAVITTPPEVYYQQDAILALHWHPEHIPMPLIRTRIKKSFPNSTDELIIPTQHNRLTSYGDFTGVEVDCYSRGFNRKVQLLVHFESSRVTDADVFKGMLAHTFKYRSSQLFEFIDSVLDDGWEERVMEAAAKTGADTELIAFARNGTAKLKKLIEKHYSSTPPGMLRNKIIQFFFDSLREPYGDSLVDRAQVFLKAVKKIVKRYFSPTHFYETKAIIEEVRSLGGCIVVPHPEQFWPILLADYDVDAYEVWNPQSREYTDFLIGVVSKKNRRARSGERPLLVTMGDDCHLSAKVRPPRFLDPAKASREVGWQPAWDDLQVRKSLVLAGVDRRKVIEEYRARLNG